MKFLVLKAFTIHFLVLFLLFFSVHVIVANYLGVWLGELCDMRTYRVRMLQCEYRVAYRYCAIGRKHDLVLKNGKQANEYR